MASNFFVDSLIFLKWLETDCDLEAPMMAKVRMLRLMTGFLNVFLSCNGKWNIEDANLRSFLHRIETVARDADEELIQISSRKDQKVPRNLDHLVSKLLQKFELLKPDIQQVYTIISKLPRPATLISYEALRGSLDSLLANLEDLVRYTADSVLFVKLELEAVEKNIRCLKNFLCFIAERCDQHEKFKGAKWNIRWRKFYMQNFKICWGSCCDLPHEKLNDLLSLAEVVTDNAACLLYMISITDRVDEEMLNGMKIELFCLVERIKPMRFNVRKVYMEALKTSRSSERATPVSDDLVSAFLDSFVSGFLDSLLDDIKELSNAKPDLRDQMESMHESLIFRRYLDPPSDKNTAVEWKLNDLLKHIDDLVNESGCIVYSAYDEMDDDMARGLHSDVSNLLAEIKVAKGRCREIYDELVPRSLRSNFPRTNELGFIKFLMQYLKELLNSQADSIAPLKHQIEALHEELEDLAKDFNKMVEQHSEHEDLKRCSANFRDIMYHTEQIIDSYVVGDGPLWCHKLGLFNVMEEIKLIKTELKSIPVKMTDEIPALRVPGFDGQVLSEAISPEIGDMLNSKNVGVFHDNAEKIIEQLTNNLTWLQILSISGMPGIGKTTLANSLYENPSVASCFHVRARCCVSQMYQKRRLLLEILRQVTNETGKFHKMDDEDLAQELYKSLKGKRYLFFIDDIWEIGHWQDMRASFPDDNMGSKIMFTTRFHEIAAQADTSSITYPLYPLSDEKSWEMLQDKLFKKENCPRKLVRVGQQIARECKGLPLAIDLIAGVLRLTERKADRWELITRSLKKELLADPERRCVGAIELSYNNLPGHLKPCFLYFGGFPEDTEVPTRKLILLWIAEGFIQQEKSDKISLEDEAETYLDELVARSLITICQRRSLGGAKTIRVHDLLHEYALAKAKEESFMLQIDSEAHRVPPKGSIRYDQHRVCFYSKRKNFAASKAFGPRVRSLLFSGYEVDDVSFIANNFKLLRVLDIATYNRPASIFSLVHLRFLALRSSQAKILHLISSLINLETFQLDGSTCESILLLENIRKLKRLRHIHINGSHINGSCTFLSSGHETFEKSFLLDNLQSMSTVHLSHGDDAEKIMRCFPNLRKFKCMVRSSMPLSFPVLEFLTKLESLNMVNKRGEVPDSYKFNFLFSENLKMFKAKLYRCKFNFPENLKKLTLSNFWLTWSQVSTIGQLPHLKVLKLSKTMFEEETWEMNEGEFLKLKVLKIKSWNVEEWNAFEGHLPCLEQLLLKRCMQLKELPSCLEEVPTLQRLELRCCSYELERSAVKVEEAQKEMGNDQLKLICMDSFSFMN